MHLAYALAGGDDYELLFTIPVDKESQFLKVMNHKVSCIGVINDNIGSIVDMEGNRLTSKGYNHFHD